MLAVLESAERSWRESDPLWAEKLRQWNAWKSNSKARERDAERESRRKKEGAHETPPESWQNVFDPDEPAPEFSFANTKCGYSKEELRKDIADLRRQNTQDLLILALERGIAVHHARMPKHYRSLVER